MPVRRHRRCGRRMACCMALRRPCINSLPRYCMPQHPLFRSHPAHPAAPSSSQSDCSCTEENFCTVENCRNAPMCISTRPLYCPYGSYQTDGVNLPTSRGSHDTDAAAANYPRAPFDRVASPSPFYTHNTSPLFPPDYGRTEGEYQNGWGYERELPSSFWERSRHNFQRSSPTRLSNAMPQFITSSPGSRNAGRFEPQISPLHRSQQPDISHSRPRADNLLPPSTHLTTTESVTGEREIVTHQNLLNFDQSHDQRDNGRPSLKNAFYRRVQCMKRGGSCGVERSSSKNHATHYNALHACDGTGGCPLPNCQGPTTDCLQNISHHEAMDQPGNVSCPALDLQTMGAPQTHLGASREPFVCNAPDLDTSATKICEINESKCPCRYPPSFKHLSCAGNISGSCSCDQK